MAELTPADSPAACACAPTHSRGRRHPEAEHGYRSPFQRDRDRIVHSAAFRRLEFKTQVFAYFESDYVRNRLTHTLEVSQLARSACRVLGLNEDLAEAIALSHDLGHPPFGHAGERALDECATGAGGYNHNIQGLRIVDHLEERYGDFPGLNLSWEVREAFAKHGSGRRAMPDEFRETGPQPALEAQLVDLCDELAYTTHDVDDGINHQHLRMRDLAGMRLWEEPFLEVKARYPDAPLGVWRHETVRRMVNRLVTDLMATTRARMADAGVRDVDEVRRRAEPLAAFSGAVGDELRALKSFLYDHLYKHPLVVQKNHKARRVVRDLYECFLEEPRQLPPKFQRRCEQWGTERVVADYVGGMTDKFALETHGRLFGAGRM